MHKSRLSRPVVIYMYGLPGSGKTFVARQLAETLGMAHLSSERIRYELFEEPRHDKAEHQVLTNLMNL
ncbi:MAG: AAA family ATPase, partial [Candidatus Saccharimonadales bacterium]